MESYIGERAIEQLGAMGTAVGGRPIALYPAGKYTKMLLERLEPGKDMPAVAFLLDDEPGERAVRGIPVLKPGEATAAGVGAVVVATQAAAERVERNARAWAEACDEDRRPGVVVLDTGVEPATVRAGDGLAPAHPDAPAGTVRARLDTDGCTEFAGDGYTVKMAGWSVRGLVRFPRVQTMPGSPMRKKDRLDVREYPTRREPGLITKRTAVSVLGSCFAQRLREWLIAHGYNYCQWEDGPGVYGSLNTSSVFNSGSLRQIFEWAYEGFDADEPVWRIDGVATDPYRQFMQWADDASVGIERRAHFDAARRMVAGSDVLILTLGMSEVWRRRSDRRCFAWLPPRSVYDPAAHECVVLTPEENLENLERVYGLCRANNPGLRLVVTLSPIPIVATNFDRHVVVSDTASKASLRAAIEVFCARHPEVVYFPSYEMVARSPRWAYDKDNWHVSDPAVIGRIMSAFMSGFGEAGADASVEAKDAAQSAGAA